MLHAMLFFELTVDLVYSISAADDFGATPVGGRDGQPFLRQCGGAGFQCLGTIMASLFCLVEEDVRAKATEQSKCVRLHDNHDADTSEDMLFSHRTSGLLSPKYIYSVNICKHGLLGEFGQHILDAFRFKVHKPNAWVQRSPFRPCAPAILAVDRKAIACVAKSDRMSHLLLNR